jgi:hypothetical protein
MLMRRTGGTRVCSLRDTGVISCGVLYFASLIIYPLSDASFPSDLL